MDVYDRFRQEGDYYDITGTQPPTAFAETPATAQVAVQQGGGIPVTRRVLSVGRNDYNMPGSLEAYQTYGIPPVMVQSDPYARIAYSYGPSGPIPLIGATSVYPHVVSSGDYDYAAPYRRTIVPVGNSLGDIMAHIERMAQLMRRSGGSGTGGGSAKKQDTKTTPQEDALALPPRDIPGAPPLTVPTVPQLQVPKDIKTPLPQTDGQKPMPINPQDIRGIPRDRLGNFYNEAPVTPSNPSVPLPSGSVIVAPPTAQENPPVIAVPEASEAAYSYPQRNDTLTALLNVLKDNRYGLGQRPQFVSPSVVRNVAVA